MMDNNDKRKYYRNHNNQNNQNYFFKKKQKKVLETDENILLSATGPIKKIVNEEDNDLNNSNATLKKKESRIFSKEWFLKYSVAIGIFLIFIFGISYSFFTYYKESNRDANITAADIYAKVLENEVTLSIPRMYPMTALEARSRSDNYVDFTVVGKNTSETRQLIYNLLIQNGEDVSGKTRIAPAYIKIDLEEYVNNAYEKIIDAETLSNFTYSGRVLPETNSEITRVFRLRAWVSDEIIISDSEPNATYTQAEFANLYATLLVSVTGEDAPPPSYGVNMVRTSIDAKQNAETNSCNPIWVDDMGTTSDESDDITYFSGDNTCVDMNYVWYSGKLWRITAIYPDGAMKLVTENMITSIAFNESSVNFYTDANTTSYMYQWLNEDFYDTLYHASEFIDTTKHWNATMPANTTISTKPAETNMVTANVGLLNSYEYYNSYRCIGSGACTGTSSDTGYLNIGYSWWLLNPYNASAVWRVGNYGNGLNSPTTLAYGGRPSINLKSGVEFTGGGTSTNPYKIKGDKEPGNTNELVNTRISGEYVKLVNNENAQIFRIIGVENNKTKIIALDYADNKATRKFATNSSDTLWGDGTTTGTDTWYTYLNNTYFTGLVSTYGNMFDSATYYLGTSGYNYKLSICANTTSGNTKVCDKTSSAGTFSIGLPRYGEMFATQQSGGYSNSIGMWLVNRNSTSYVWHVGDYGSGTRNDPLYAYGGRPTLHLKSTVKILSGSGTESDPYVVGLGV